MFSKFRRSVLLSCLILFAAGIAQAQGDSAAQPVGAENVADIDSEIQVGGEQIEDAVIASRIQELFTNIDALAGIDSQVTAGVVRLSGSAGSKQAHEQALRVVQRVQGVVAVNDQITVDRSISRRMARVAGDLTDRAFDVIAYLPLLLVAIAVFVLFWLLASVLTRWDRPYARLTANPFLQSLLRQIVRGAIVLVGFVVLLQILDATALLGTVLGAAGILGLAIGFAIRDTVENYLASILLSLRQPFDANDQVVIEGFEGLVIRLTSRETVLMTLDGNHVRIPNATVYKSILTNFSRNPKRRFSFEVGVDTGVGLNAARALGVKTLAATAGVLESPPPACRIEMLGDSNVVLLMVGWVDQNQSDFNKVRSEAIRAIKNAFEAADYEMPEPIYRVKVEGLGQSGELAAPPVPESAEKKRKALPEGEESPGDVTREHFIEQQIAEEKRSQGDEEDLLDDDEPKAKR